PHEADDGRRTEEDVGVRKQLIDHLLADVLFVGHARHHHTGGGGDDQGRNLCNQAVTNGQQRIDFGRLTEGKTMLTHTNNQTADDVDDHHQQPSDGVAPYKLAGAIHGPIELGFLSDFLTAAASFVFTNEAGIEVGVDGHLLAGHGIQCEACAHFGDSPRTLGDHHKVDDDKDDEDDETDRQIT